MTTTQTSEAATLSDACQALLSSLEMFAEDANNHGIAQVFTSEGDFVFSVTAGISEHDLRTLISHGRRRYDAGVQAGREAIAEGFRSLIGVAKAAA